MSPKYAPLAAFLAAQAPETATITLTLVDVEETIGTSLPPSAKARRWWVNSEELKHALVWLEAGWLVTARSLRTQNPMITFARMGQIQPARRSPLAAYGHPSAALSASGRYSHSGRVAAVGRVDTTE